MRAPAESYEQRVTPLELFFDLVFVFAITRVTGLMAHELSWESIAQGLLVLAALWWGWAAYAWLTNHVSGADERARLVVFVAMGAMVLVALAVPEAFAAHALLFALGVEQVVGHVDETLEPEASTALYGGVAVYLVAHVAFKLRATGGLGPHRLVAAVVCAACVPIGTEVGGLAALAVVTAIAVGLIVYEVVRFREARAGVRLAA